jgi:GMP synthase-like glutamine amidotransferase
MILYVAMAVSEADYLSRAEGFFRHKLIFERLSGRPCLVRRCSEVGPEFMARYPVAAILISGFGKSWEEFNLPDLHGLNDVLRATDRPVLGLCGGHQLVGEVFSRDLRAVEKLEDEPIRRLAEGEADLYPSYHAGWFTETGMQPVRVREREDPLFAGLPETVMVLESHYCEVKAPPPDFLLLAENDNCRVQAMRHRERPVYGVQFHPEGYTDDYPHGRRILENFFRMAEVGG